MLRYTCWLYYYYHYRRRHHHHYIGSQLPRAKRVVYNNTSIPTITIDLCIILCIKCNEYRRRRLRDRGCVIYRSIAGSICSVIWRVNILFFYDHNIMVSISAMTFGRNNKSYRCNNTCIIF